MIKKFFHAYVAFEGFLCKGKKLLLLLVLVALFTVRMGPSIFEVSDRFSFEMGYVFPLVSLISYTSYPSPFNPRPRSLLPSSFLSSLRLEHSHPILSTSTLIFTLLLFSLLEANHLSIRSVLDPIHRFVPFIVYPSSPLSFPRFLILIFLFY